MFRNLSGAVSTPPQLREEILKQFGPELVPDDLNFPVGYTKGGNKVWIKANVQRISAVKLIVIVTIPSSTRKDARSKGRSLHLKRKQTELKSSLLSRGKSTGVDIIPFSIAYGRRLQM